MADNKDNWFNRRIDPLPSDDGVNTEAVKDRLEILRSRQTHGAAAKPAERLIDVFWRDHGHKPDQQAAWHVFYAGLSADQKNQLWNEYHKIVGSAEEASEYLQPEPPTDPAKLDYTFSDSEETEISQYDGKTNPEKTEQPRSRQERQKLSGIKRHVRPLMSAAIAMLLFLSVTYNQLVIAQVKQYVSPGDSLQAPIILEPDVDLEIGNEPRIIIPKINVDVPVVYDISSFSENAIQTGLERGVVHYGTTPLPGEAGNNVIVGHSSNNFLNSGKYKFAFVLLDKLKIGDTFILHYEGSRFVYKVTRKQVVDPTDFSLIQPTVKPTTTLITCTPPGTSWNRLIVQAEQISPEPTSRAPEEGTITPLNEETGQPEIVPGNAPSFWHRLLNSLFG